jgi:phage terminase large subunit-like protein
MIKQNIDFTGWIRSGLIKTIPGNAVDHNIILDDIREIAKQYTILSIGYDRKFAAPIVIGLSDITKMNEISQDLGTISYPTTKLEKMILSKGLNHYGNPVLCWMFSNISIYRGEGDLIRITKKGSQDRVDGCVALVMAIAEWEAAKMIPKSKYDDPNYELIAF